MLNPDVQRTAPTRTTIALAIAALYSSSFRRSDPSNDGPGTKLEGVVYDPTGAVVPRSDSYSSVPSRPPRRWNS